MRRRGQTLVVFALTLLLLVLMVTMTLSIGMKAKEKMELQTVADAAAYSNAVATARAFNSISLMNRALMGHMVAMTGVESLISWSSYYRASIHAAVNAYDQPFDVYALIAATNCPLPNPASVKLCQCSTKAMTDISRAQSDLRRADSRLRNNWNRLDQRAGLEAKKLQIGTISAEQQDVYKQLTESVIESKLAESIVKEADKGARFSGELKALEVGVNKRELEGGWGCSGEGAACSRRDAGHKLHFVDAAMGSRGYAFVTGRGQGGLIQMKLQTVMPSGDVVTSVTNSGSGYFPAEGRMTHSAQSIDATEVWGDDHGTVSILFTRGQAPCPPVLPGSSGARAHVRSNHQGDSSDEHQWTGGSDTNAQIHTMGTCTQCPGMWPSHMDYNYKLVTRDADNWGQPKNYAVIQRDYKQRPDKRADPWNLLFRFRFSPSRAGTTFDNRGIQLSPANGGTDISEATALSAGIAYYKREGNFWREPPNFLNPFWRATLVSAHVDEQGEQRDVAQALNAAAPFSADAYRALKREGYEGW
ncbi:pilus assembly protein TadG-related protein [Vitiosangium sp. GDMCC 1.1324]|uniref:pilus assembly protein TadG-related protein n=1 Tax=Vitiosangium sp. (strain GDMCC 1.1324) TaxID=2138576 RepID=UPI000D340EC3|nr:pilus assembly protein TadG-related protein [Vitiosangium sp. GDMCC 1.1324]PTL84616.1 pilus assembly protein [Vitiosangium sp. GDMCC 1.1324]